MTRVGDLLELDGVSKRFGGVEAVRRFTLTVSEGETVGLMGPNGAGKTTLFNLISGAMAPDEGEMAFGGEPLAGVGLHRRASLGIARTFQIPRPFSRMTVAENVEAGAAFGRLSEPRIRASTSARETLDRVGLLESADVLAGSLSLADQRRLEIARALATAPKLLLLDEVMAGLSAVERRQMIALIAQLREERGLAMIVSEHVVDAVTRLCGRVVVMNRGMKLADGETGGVLASVPVVEAYLMGAAKRAGEGRAVAPGAGA